jgi:hypothetical protein
VYQPPAVPVLCDSITTVPLWHLVKLRPHFALKTSHISELRSYDIWLAVGWKRSATYLYFFETYLRELYMHCSMSEYVLSFPWYMLCTYWYLWGLVGTYYWVYRSPSLDIIYIIWYHRPLEWSSGGVYHIYGSSNNHLWSDPSEELVSGVILWRSYRICGSWHTNVRQGRHISTWMTWILRSTLW